MSQQHPKPTYPLRCKQSDRRVCAKTQAGFQNKHFALDSSRKTWLVPTREKPAVPVAWATASTQSRTGLWGTWANMGPWGKGNNGGRGGFCIAKTQGGGRKGQHPKGGISEKVYCFAQAMLRPCAGFESDAQAMRRPCAGFGSGLSKLCSGLSKLAQALAQAGAWVLESDRQNFARGRKFLLRLGFHHKGSHRSHWL